MYEEPPNLASRARKAVVRLILGVVFVALLGALVFLVSQLNARTYSLMVQDGRLIVLKGRMMPMGAMPYRPADPVLAEAYAPISLDGPVPADLLNQRFTERDELDRVLFNLLERMGKPRVQSEDPSEVERGLAYLRRAERLSGLNEEQRATLKALQADVAFYQARGRLEEARRLLADALNQLKLASDSTNRHARAANQMITEIEPAAKGLEEALRRAVHSLSAPAAEPSPADAAPPITPNAN